MKTTITASLAAAGLALAGIAHAQQGGAMGAEAMPPEESAVPGQTGATGPAMSPEQTAQAAQASGRKLVATLEGTAEVPSPGDTDGQGVFAARLDPATGKLCYSLQVEDITAPSAAHIHQAPAGEAGDVVVTLEAPDASNESTACTEIDPALARAMLRSPSDFYVNVHNAEFSDGAIRGQLLTG